MQTLTPTIFGQVVDGRLVPDNKERLLRWIKKLSGKRVEIIIRLIRKQRTDAQNRYYFGVIVPMIADDTGEDQKRRIHRFLAAQFLKRRELVQLVGGKKVFAETIRSTTELSTAEFEEYTDKCRRWAAQELGIVIPLPNEVDLSALTIEV